MKGLVNTILVTLIAVISTYSVSAQQSDYEVKQEFEARYESLETTITMANSVNRIDSILLAIDDLALDNIEHEELLNFALYPESYASAISKLKSDARTAEYKLLIIENQTERLTILSDELGSYKQEILNLVKRSDSLRLAIANSQESERKLSELVRNYRKSVEQRDEFIFDIVDSLFITYKELNPNAVKELARQHNGRSLTNTDNPLSIISSIVDQNIETLKVNDKSLSTEDYLRMYALQKKVANVWKQIGDELVIIYGGNNKNKWMQGISADIEEWKASASYAMWSSLDDYLDYQDINLDAFDNNQSFFAALDSFVTRASITSDGNILKQDSYHDFKAFKMLWSKTMMNDWNKYLVEADVLTTTQLASIDSKVDEWGEKSRPLSFGYFVLFGVGLIAVLGFIVAQVKR